MVSAIEEDKVVTRAGHNSREKKEHSQVVDEKVEPATEPEKGKDGR